MTLRIHAASPFCRKLLAAVRVRRQRIPVEEAPLTRDPAALGELPLLRTEHGALVQTGAIVAWLEREHPRLVPPDQAEAVHDLDRMIDLYLLEPVVTLGCHPGTPAARAAAETAGRLLALLEARLDEGPWLLGDGPTLADLGAVIGASDLQHLGLTLPPRVADLLARAREVPGLGEVLAEGDALWDVLGALDEDLRLAA